MKIWIIYYYISYMHFYCKIMVNYAGSYDYSIIQKLLLNVYVVYFLSLFGHL